MKFKCIKGKHIWFIARQKFKGKTYKNSEYGYYCKKCQAIKDVFFRDSKDGEIIGYENIILKSGDIGK